MSYKTVIAVILKVLLATLKFTKDNLLLTEKSC